MSAVPITTERCDECGRNPRTINSDCSECSVVACPHRAKAWSDFPNECHGRWRPERPSDPLGPLFDKVRD